MLWRTKRKIIQGEELLIDYGTIVDADAISLKKCLCGAVQCRNIITYKDWMLPQVQERHGSDFATPILRKILKYSESDYASEIELSQNIDHSIFQNARKFYSKKKNSTNSNRNDFSSKESELS